ncbi:MAG: STAS/SEC14 domain-containing protein [Methanolobus sp.]|nr:STAS/SEC14 domain-containing protein [Methanolobus sp.]
MFEDMKLGVENFNSFGKIAVVSDVDWMIDAVEIFKHIIPGTVKTYSNEELPEAKAWISE